MKYAKPVLRGALLTLTASVCAAAFHIGCASNTGESRFSFDASAGGTSGIAAGEPLTFVNERGWTITLTEATVTLGPVYLNVVSPLTAPTTSLLDVFVKSAWAHGESHLAEGRVVGEVLGQVTFSALSSAMVPFPVRGTVVSEPVHTADIWLYPKPGVSPDTTNIDSPSVVVAGSARSATETVRFRGALVLNEAWQPEAIPGSRGAQSIAEIRRVRGVPSAFYPTEGGHLELRFDIKELFRGAEFSNLEDSPEATDGTKLLVQSKSGKYTTDQVMTNMYQGLRSSTDTYSVHWIER